MARYFGNATTDRVNCGSPAAADDLTALTVIATARLTTLIGGRVLLGKRSGGTFGNTGQPGWAFSYNGTTGSLQATWTRATTNLIYRSTDNLAPNVGTWYHLAMTIDQGATAGSLARLYGAPVGSPLVETSAYSTAQDGGGAYSSDAAQDLLIGNVASLTLAPDGDIDRVALYTGVLTLDQINAQIGRYLHPNLLGHWRPGWGGADTDLSGNVNNGTVTGATLSDPAPIGMRAVGSLWVPRSATAAVTPLHLLPRNRVTVYPRRRVRPRTPLEASILAPLDLSAPTSSGSAYLRQAQRRAHAGGFQVLTGGV